MEDFEKNFERTVQHNAHSFYESSARCHVALVFTPQRAETAGVSQTDFTYSSLLFLSTLLGC